MITFIIIIIIIITINTHWLNILYIQYINT